MTPEEIKAEVEEMMQDRGYSLEAAVSKVATVADIPEEEVREACEDLFPEEDPD